MNEINEPLNSKQEGYSSVVERTQEIHAVPGATREVTYVRRPGISPTTLIAILAGVLVVGLIGFFLYTQQQDDQHQAEIRQMQEREAIAANKPAPPPVIVQQPAPQPQQPVVIQQPAQQAPIVVERQGPPVVINQQPAATTTKPSNEPDDTTIQLNITQKLTTDSSIAPLGIVATVSDGKVTLSGSVTTKELKQRVERMVKGLRGVHKVDNQITVFDS